MGTILRKKFTKSQFVISMINGQKLIFLTFSDSRYNSWKRLKKEALHTGWFDTIVAGDERLFEDWYIEKYKERFSERGYGYWQWKSYLIRRELEKMDENDLLLYCDAGCCINEKGYLQFLSYINQVNMHSSGFLCFEQGLRAGEWTKADVFDYFGVLNKDEFIEGNQIAAGVLLIRKNEISCEIVDKWFYLMHNQHYLATDEPSSIKNLCIFRENRHDQSVLDIITRMYKVLRLNFSEVYRLDEDWSLLSEKPILYARKRDISISMIKRFKRYLKKMINVGMVIP